MAGDKRKGTPFKSFSTLKRMVVLQHFKARLLGRLGWKVAWVTSGAPVELLLSFGILPLYPEKHAAVCSARHLAADMKEDSVRRGFSPDLCTYALLDLGSVATGVSPLGGMARPDLLVACNNICGTVLKWYQALQQRFGVPLVFVDTPFLGDAIEPGAPAPDHAVAYVRGQLEEMIATLEKVAQRRFDEQRLRQVLERSADAIDLWGKVLDANRARPAPMTCFDAFVLMAPIVTLRGTRGAVSFYRGLLAEIEERVRRGVAAVPGERTRVVWDNLPVWGKMRDLSRYFKSKNVCLVADTYTGAWAGNIMRDDPSLENVARTYLSIFLNRGLRSRGEVLAGLVRRFEADAFVMHSNRSCKPYSFGQYDIQRLVSGETGKPGVVIEADHGDPSFFNDAQVFSKLDAFFENV